MRIKRVCQLCPIGPEENNNGPTITRKKEEEKTAFVLAFGIFPCSSFKIVNKTNNFERTNSALCNTWMDNLHILLNENYYSFGIGGSCL